MTFHVGQKVVCVDDDWWSDECASPPAMPTKNGVYVIAHIECDEVGYFYLSLIGFPVEIGWNALAFRPLTERKTDISIFTSLLDPSNHTPLPEQNPKRRKVSHDLCGNE